MNKIALVNMILSDLGINKERLALEWVSASESPRFVEKVTEFTDRIRGLGLMGEAEGIDHETLMRRIKAARTAAGGMKLRMAFAKQAKQMKKDGQYGEIPFQEKLAATFAKEMTRHEKTL